MEITKLGYVLLVILPDLEFSPLIKLEALKASIERVRSGRLMYYLIGLQQISLYSVSAVNKCLFKGCSLCLLHALNRTCFTAPPEVFSVPFLRH